MVISVIGQYIILLFVKLLFENQNFSESKSFKTAYIDFLQNYQMNLFKLKKVYSFICKITQIMEDLNSQTVMFPHNFLLNIVSKSAI